MSALLLAGAYCAAGAIPSLSLVEAGGVTTRAESITIGTPTFSLDLVVDTAGLSVSGLQYYLTSSPANTLRFATEEPPLTALDSPFPAGDLFLAPSAGAAVNQSGSTTIWFKASAGDYPALSGSTIGRYVLNTSSLPVGTYVITPIGQELSNATATISSFEPPGAFTLTVIVPEPRAPALVVLGATWLLLHRRRKSSGIWL